MAMEKLDESKLEWRLQLWVLRVPCELASIVTRLSCCCVLVRLAECVRAADDLPLCVRVCGLPMIFRCLCVCCW